MVVNSFHRVKPTNITIDIRGDGEYCSYSYFFFSNNSYVPFADYSLCYIGWPVFISLSQQHSVIKHWLSNKLMHKRNMIDNFEINKKDACNPMLAKKVRVTYIHTSTYQNKHFM